MKLVQRIETLESDMLAKYADTFTGLGCITGVTHHIKLDPHHKPVVHAPRKVPVTIRSKVKEELERMERLDVIERIQEPTDWVNSMVNVVKPNGKLRICIDPRDLNKAIKREFYPMKTVEEVAARMPNAKLFSKLDASSGFWQVKLDHESAKLCTFNTPFGRYMFKRLPFGISSAQDVFQAIMTEMFEDIDGVEVVVDDVIVWGTTEEEHDKRLKKVLQRAQERNLKLNKDKSQIKKKHISYIGHVIGEDGVRPDPKKVTAVVEMKTPACKDELQRFLGMTTYLSKFIENYSKMSAPLRVLLEKDTEWHWTDRQDAAIQQLKTAVTIAPVLKFFDPSQPTTISVDASSKGMGAVLLQNQSPIAYASKSLTATQQNYAQIEKEMLAIVFGCQKFHDYVYGLPNVDIETDHKPLETILRKPLHAAPARLQRMMMSIQKYPISVTFKPGKELLIADTLSRASLPDVADELEFRQYDINILHTLPITEPKLEEFKEQTKKDARLQELVHTVQGGWPEHKANSLPGARPFWNFRDELTYHEGILFKGARVIVPTCMRPEMLRLIHGSHLGVDKCKRRARDVLYWPGMAAQIEDTVSNCSTCAMYQRNNPKQPLLPHPAPSRPWERVGADLCELGGKHYLILVDYYSNFIEVDHLKETTSLQVIERLKPHFARHGIPDILITDNGPQFSSDTFHKFSADYQFQHHTSSPHYPRSNGKAEKSVQTVKNLLRKAQAENSDFHLALLDFRNSPTTDDVGSPAQRLMGRRTKTLLPTAEKLLLPKTIPPTIVKSEHLRQQETQKHFYDKTSKPLSPLKPGDRVRYRSGKLWLPAVIVEISEHPRSYTIQTPQGQTYRRNRVHLKPDAPFGNDTDDEDDPHSDEERGDNASDPGREVVESATSAPDTATTSSAPTELRRSKRTTRGLTVMPTPIPSSFEEGGCDNVHSIINHKTIIIIIIIIHTLHHDD